MARSWAEAVQLLTELDGAETLTKFQVGDLVLEQAPWGEGSVHNGSEETIRRLAADAGLSFDTLRERRKVAYRIPAGVRTPAVSFSVFVLIATQSGEEERARLLKMIRNDRAPTPHGRWTVDSLRVYLGIRPTRYPPPSEESDAALARRLLAKPEVAEAVVSDVQTRGQIAAAQYRVEEREAQQRERVIRTSPVAGTLRALDEVEAAEQLLDIIGQANTRLAEVLPQVRSLGTINRVFLGDMLAKLDEHLAQVRHLASRGQSDIDSFMAGVLQERGEP